MKKLFNIFILSALFIPMLFSGCKSDEEDPIKIPSNVVPYDPSKQTDRSWLEETATTFLGYVKPSDQQALITTLRLFSSYCENSPFPDNFYDEKYVSDAARSASDLALALEQSDVPSLSRAASAFVYSLARFKGVYQHNSGINAWQYLEPSEDVRFRFWNGTTEYTFLVSGDGGTWTESYQLDGQTYTFEVPKNLNVALMQGTSMSSTLLSVILKTDGKDNDHLNVTSEVKAANVMVNTTIKATNAKMTEETVLNINNSSTLVRTTLMTSTCEIAGSNLCSISAWRKAAESDDFDAYNSIVSNASAAMNVLDRVVVKSQLTNIGKFIECTDGYWDSYESTNPKGDAENAAKSLSSALKAQMYYAGDNNAVRANLGWEAFLDYSYDTYEEWGVRPLIIFTSDNTPYSFSEYFGESNFLGVHKQFNSIFNTYKSYWK